MSFLSVFDICPFLCVFEGTPEQRAETAAFALMILQVRDTLNERLNALITNFSFRIQQMPEMFAAKEHKYLVNKRQNIYIKNTRSFLF